VIQASHWRRGGPDGREPIASSSDIVSLAAYCKPRPQAWGKVTSHRPLDRRELEFLAWKMGCTVQALQHAISMGLFHG
jgi:hypothetical protein